MTEVSLGSRLAIAVIVTFYCLGIGLLLLIATIFLIMFIAGFNFGKDAPSPLVLLFFAMVIGGPAAGTWLVMKASRYSIGAARGGLVFLEPVVAVCVLSTCYLVYDVMVQERTEHFLFLLGLPLVTGFFATFIPREAEVRDWHVAFVGALGGLGLLASLAQ